MNHTQNQSPAVSVGSSDLNKGPTAFSKGREDVLQIRLPATTKKRRRNRNKVTELNIATYNVKTLSDDCHLTSLENEIEKINWDISEMRRPGEKVIQFANQHKMFNKGNDGKQGGVGFLVNKKLQGNIEDCMPPQVELHPLPSESRNDTKSKLSKFMRQPHSPVKKNWMNSMMTYIL